MTTAILMLFMHRAVATIRTVNNLGTAQFSDIGSAITASSKGDTIYIHGSPYGYSISPTYVFKDSLTFIGPGFNPTKQNPHVAYIASRWWAGHNNTFIGLFMQDVGHNPVTGHYLNTRFIRCRIKAMYGLCENNYISNMLFDGCILEGFILFNVVPASCNGSRNFYGATIRNCLFYGAYIYGGGYNSFNDLVVENCIFYHGNPSTIVTPINGTFTNNIFVNANVDPANNPGVVFNNNFSTTENLNVSGNSGNVQGTSPSFVNAPGGTFAFSHDYHLATGSPCLGTGTGGTDMGIYSGAAPFHMDGASSIPQINYFNVLGTQILQGNSIKVSFQSVIKN